MASAMKTRPNDRCPCGSGKKYKKCCKDKQPRSHSVYIDVAPIMNTKAKSLSGISFDAESGNILLHTPLGETVKVENMLSTSAYQRENQSKGDKLLCLSEGISFNNAPGQLHFSLHDYLSKFDIVFATDTNTWTINGENVSVGVMFRLYVKRTRVREGLFRYDIPKGAFGFRRETPSGIEAGIDAIHVGDVPIPISESRAICFRGLSGGNAEKYTIYRLVNNITSANQDSNIKIGIITDHLNAIFKDGSLDGDFSHPKNLDAIMGSLNNDRENVPLYGNFFLPENVEIVYASDAANDTLLNFAVRKCHKEADELLKGLKEKGFIGIGKQIPFEQIPYVNATPG